MGGKNERMEDWHLYHYIPTVKGFYRKLITNLIKSHDFLLTGTDIAIYMIVVF